ncbi:MAG: SIS domain-containing protein [Candidatus Liptonbacteria bacterium]|nr:SIS domain-containing protein [Candidatus Liptonbacteria bacterium]
MKEAIKNFGKQFAFNPEIKNQRNLRKKKAFIVAGMGGSALAADLLRVWDSKLKLIIHRNYGLPNLSKAELADYLFIASSYSGNTEEVLDALREARKAKMAVAVVATGGKLLREAEKGNLPYIKLPDKGIQPRMALGISAKAILKLMGNELGLKKISKLTGLRPEIFEKKGKALSKKLAGFIPVIYASQRNMAVAYTWKIKFNETGKVPAFANRFPELNHNEMTGFDGKGEANKLAKKFYFIILRDRDDDRRISRRMEVIGNLLKKRNLKFETINLEASEFHKIFNSLLLADWTAYYLAHHYGSDPEAVPMVEQFKKLL